MRSQQFRHFINRCVYFRSGLFVHADGGFLARNVLILEFSITARVNYYQCPLWLFCCCYRLVISCHAKFNDNIKNFRYHINIHSVSKLTRHFKRKSNEKLPVSCQLVIAFWYYGMKLLCNNIIRSIWKRICSHDKLKNAVRRRRDFALRS